jgi:hypothetical protein
VAIAAGNQAKKAGKESEGGKRENKGNVERMSSRTAGDELA